jgi:hypothetical protein
MKGPLIPGVPKVNAANASGVAKGLGQAKAPGLATAPGQQKATPQQSAVPQQKPMQPVQATQQKQVSPQYEKAIPMQSANPQGNLARAGAAPMIAPTPQAPVRTAPVQSPMQAPSPDRMQAHVMPAVQPGGVSLPMQGGELARAAVQPQTMADPMQGMMQPGMLATAGPGQPMPSPVQQAAIEQQRAAILAQQLQAQMQARMQAQQRQPIQTGSSWGPVVELNPYGKK